MKAHLIGLVAASLSITGCGGSSSSNSERSASTSEVAIAFAAVAGTEAIDCATTYTLGSANTEVTLEDFRFYLHDLRLITDSGEEVAVTLAQNDWQNGDIALVDFQDQADKCSGDSKSIHTIVSGTVPNQGQSFTGVSFVIGVPAASNHRLSSAQPSPLNVTSLFWAWQSGYKFMRLDVAPVGGGDNQATGNTFTAWNIHLGSTGCSGDPQSGDTVTCTNNNRPRITLDNFDLNSQQVQVNYGALVANSNLSLNQGGAPGCMSGVDDPECNDLFTALGLNLASGENDDNLTQTVFSVAP